MWFLGVRVAKKDMVPTDTGWSNTLFTQTRDRTRSASIVHNGPAQTVPLSPQLTQVCMHPTCASGEEPHSLPPGQNTAVRIATCTCFEHNKEELITPRTRGYAQCRLQWFPISGEGQVPVQGTLLSSPASVSWLCMTAFPQIIHRDTHLTG